VISPPTFPGGSEPRRHVMPILVVVVYVLLWGFEGAARKWVPGLESILYVARDAFIAVALIVTLLGSSRTRRQPAVVWAFIGIVILMSSLSIIMGSPVAVGIIGARSYLAPVLLVVFVLSCERSDIFFLPTLRTICVIALVNVPVTVVQVLSSPAAVINKQVGDGTAYFVNPGDIVRASGTFSSPLGHTQLQPLALAAAIVALHSRSVSRWLSVPTLFGVALMTLLSGSRGAVISDLVVVVVYLLALVTMATFRSLLTAFTAIGTLVLLVVVTVTVFPAVIQSFLTRIDQASRAEDVSGRVLGNTFDFLTTPLSMLGSGAGSASTAAQNLGVGVAVENDMPRWVTELGVLGFALCVLRLAAGVYFVAAILRGPRRGSLAIMMFSAVLAPVALTGVITLTPSSQGAFAIALSLYMIAIRDRADHSPPSAQFGSVDATGMSLVGATASRDLRNDG